MQKLIVFEFNIILLDNIDRYSTYQRYYIRHNEGLLHAKSYEEETSKDP